MFLFLAASLQWFCLLTRPDASPLYLNPEKISSISLNPAYTCGGTGAVIITNVVTFCVRETPKEVVEKCGVAR